MSFVTIRPTTVVAPAAADEVSPPKAAQFAGPKPRCRGRDDG
jgi:hypothetical protein